MGLGQYENIIIVMTSWTQYFVVYCSTCHEIILNSILKYLYRNISCINYNSTLVSLSFLFRYFLFHLDVKKYIYIYKYTCIQLHFFSVYLCIKLVYWSSFSAIVTEVQILLIGCNWQKVRKIEIQGTWMFQTKWRVTTVNSVYRIY